MDDLWKCSTISAIMGIKLLVWLSIRSLTISQTASKTKQNKPFAYPGPWPGAWGRRRRNLPGTSSRKVGPTGQRKCSNVYQQNSDRSSSRCWWCGVRVASCWHPRWSLNSWCCGRGEWVGWRSSWRRDRILGTSTGLLDEGVKTGNTST